MGIFLSFVITTRNKKDLLCELLDSLIESLQEDEEIVVIDSASVDGTVDALQVYSNRCNALRFISEPDVGEAHGFNKGIMQANGDYIKIVSDDDIYDWTLTRFVKQYLKDHPADVLFTNGMTTTTDKHCQLLTYDKEYSAWRNHGTPFAFCGLGLFIRNESLPLVGLFSTNFKRVDAELSLRITSLPRLNLVHFNAITWIRRLNPSSNSVKLKKSIRTEMIKLLLLYKGIGGLIEWTSNRFINQSYASKNRDEWLQYRTGLNLINEYNSSRQVGFKGRA